MKRGELALIAVVSIAGLAFYAAQSKELRQANYRISQLERELRVTKSPTTQSSSQPERSVEEAKQSAGETAGFSSTNSEINTSAVKTSPSSTGSRLSLTEWRTNEQLEEIEKYLSLTDAQRESLRLALKQSIGQSPEQTAASSDGESSSAPRVLDQERIKQARQEAVTAVLGETASSQLEDQLAQEQQQQVAQELDSETYSLSRKLQLTAEQEEHLRTALSYTQVILAQDKKLLGDKMAEAMAQHFDQDPERAQLRDLYQEIKALSSQMNTKKYATLAEQLTGVLSEEQLSNLVILNGSGSQ